MDFWSVFDVLSPDISDVPLCVRDSCSTTGDGSAISSEDSTPLRARASDCKTAGISLFKVCFALLARASLRDEAGGAPFDACVLPIYISERTRGGNCDVVAVEQCSMLGSKMVLDV